MSKLTRWSPFALLALLPVLLLAVPLLSSPPKPAPAQDNAYVGMDQCAACHEETVTAFKETLHGKKGFEMRSKNAFSSVPSATGWMSTPSPSQVPASAASGPRWRSVSGSGSGSV